MASERTGVVRDSECVVAVSAAVVCVLALSLSCCVVDAVAVDVVVSLAPEAVAPVSSIWGRGEVACCITQQVNRYMYIHKCKKSFHQMKSDVVMHNVGYNISARSLFNSFTCCESTDSLIHNTYIYTVYREEKARGTCIYRKYDENAVHYLTLTDLSIDAGIFLG